MTSPNPADVVGQQPAPPATSPQVPGDPSRRRISGATRQQGFFLAVIVAMFLAAMPFLPQFHNGQYLMIQLSSYAAILIMALGQTFVVIQVGFDLSTGAMQGFMGGLVFVLVGWQVPDGLVILAGLGVALAVGVLVHGLLIAKAKINFFIVTLASFTILPSLLRVLLNGSSKPVFSPTLDAMANGSIAGIRTPVIIGAVVFGAMWVLLNRTVFGRNVYAVGSNPEAARLAGVNVDRVAMTCYGICALCAGIAGLLLVGSLGAADPSAGLGNEFFALTAVLLGGTRFSGGAGTLFGTLLGLVFLIVLSNILLLSGLPQFWIGAVQGVVLLVAVGIDRARRDA